MACDVLRGCGHSGGALAWGLNAGASRKGRPVWVIHVVWETTFDSSPISVYHGAVDTVDRHHAKFGYQQSL